MTAEETGGRMFERMKGGQQVGCEKRIRERDDLQLH